MTEKETNRERARKSYYKDPEKSKAYHKKYLKTRPASYSAWILVKSRAKKLGLPFDLTLEDIPEKSICPVFQTEIAFGLSKPIDPMRSSSIDRLVPSKGYIKENIRIISFRANQIKNDASVEDLRKVLKYVEDNLLEED